MVTDGLRKTRWRRKATAAAGWQGGHGTGGETRATGALFLRVREVAWILGVGTQFTELRLGVRPQGQDV
jgi:hypothetical protein